MRRTLLAALAVLVLATGLAVTVSAPRAQTATAITQIFCKAGYHRVLRHRPPPPHYVCVRNDLGAGVVLTAANGTDPPQNVVFYVLNPSGRRVWFDATGMGADAPAGVKVAVKVMIADGFTLVIKDHDCGWRANPCVLEWPGPS